MKMALGSTPLVFILACCCQYSSGQDQTVDPGNRQLPGEILHENCTDYTNYPVEQDFAVVTATCKARQEIWLLKADAEGSRPPAGSKVVARRTIAPLKKGEIFLSGPFCYDKLGKEVFLSAVFHWTGKRSVQRGDKVIKDAWMADAKQQRIVPVPKSFIKQIRCAISDE